MKNVLYARALKAFTALELLIAFSVCSIVAAITLPQIPRVIEAQRANAATVVLNNILMAERRFFSENNDYANSLGQLDVAITVPQGFNLSLMGAPGQLARLTRVEGGYSVSIRPDGQIACHGSQCALIGMEAAGTE